MSRRSDPTPEERRARSGAQRDLVVVAVIAAAVFIAGVALNIWEATDGWLSARFRNKEDEIYALFVVVSVALAVIAARRWLQAARESHLRAETDRRFRALVEEVPAVTYTWDPTKPTGSAMYPYVSPQIETVLGFTPQEYRSTPTFWLDQIHPEDRDRVIAASDHADLTGEPFNIEYRTYTKDGRIVWLRDESVVVKRDASGSALLSQGVMFDITKQKEAEQRLQETENRFRTIVERVPAVSYVWDGADEPGSAPAAYISPQIEHLLGFTSDEWRADPEIWARRLHPEDLQRVLSSWERAVSSGASFSSVYRIYTARGEQVWIRDEAVPVSVGRTGLPLYQGVMFDVTEQKQAESRLREAESKFRTLVEQLPAVTYIEDPTTGANLYISPQIEDIFGYTPEEWLASPNLWEERLHPDDHDWVVQENALDLGDTWSVDYRTLARDGRVVWIHNEAVMIRSESGAPLFWQGVVFDITERKAAEARLKEAEQRYRALVEHLPAVVYMDAVDEESTALYISPQYEAVFGFTVQERLDDAGLWLRQLHPDDLERVQAESIRTNETGEPFRIEYRWIRKDGKIIWVRDEAYLVGDDEGSDKFWHGVLMDVTERKEAEEALTSRDRILEAAGFAAASFLSTPEWTDSIDAVLERLGTAANASRAYVFENEVAADGDLQTTGRFEWVEEGITSTAFEDYNIGFSYEGNGFSRWVEELSEGTIIHGPTRGFPDSEQADFAQEQGILSCAVMPIFVADEWWGFIGFDDCLEPRVWHPAEIEALTVAANTLAAAIGRERAEKRLAQAESRYRTLVETIPAITYVQPVEPDGPRYISPQLMTMLGYSPEEWGWDIWFRSLHPDDADRVMAEEHRTDETGEPFHQEYRMFHKDGSLLWVQDDAVLFNDEQGRPSYWQGVRIDITSRKTAEESVRRAEERYRTLVEELPAVTYIDALGDADPFSWPTQYISPQVKEILGYSPEEWKADPTLWSSLVHPEDRERAREADRRHFDTGEPLAIDVRVTARDGQVKWIRDQATMIYDDEGRPYLSQGFLLDITERRAAEEQLREAEQRYRAIVEHVPAIIYVDLPDESQRTVYVSPQVEEVTGITQQEWIDDPDCWLKAIHPDDREDARESFVAALRESLPWSAEYRMITRDGRTIWLRDDCAMMRDDEGTPLFIQGVIFDITERKLAEEALRDSEQRERQAAERLRDLDEMKNTFLAAVSHELRSPLTSILGLSLTLERQSELPAEDQADLLERLSTNARKLDRLLKDLLDIDRLSRGIVTPLYRITDVGTLARRMVTSIEALADRTVVVEIDPVVISIDQAKVERIIENLMVNAVRHTTPDRTIWLKVREQDGGALIAVEDDGVGVPMDLREAIFEPFTQGPTPSSHSPGTGIGLSLVGRFAELHRGRAWVEEREGGGASFRVFLPQGPRDVAEDPSGSDEAPATSDAALRR